MSHESYKLLFNLQTFSLAGLGAGVLEAILVNPFEMVKVTLQANRNKSQVPSTWAVTRQIIAKDGIGSRGLNRGLSATIGRNGVFNMLYFGFYHSVKNIVPEYQDPYQELMRKIALGFASGMLGSVVNIPFDVAKSRIQGPQPQEGIVKYRSTFPTIATVYREEGFAALYKGLTPKVMRLAPGGAIMLITYDYVYEAIDKYFP